MNTPTVTAIHPEEKQFEIKPDVRAYALCLEVIVSWPDWSQLETFARERHGYGDSNAQIGLSYPADLDDDEAAEISLPEGSILCYADWTKEAYQLSEKEYLIILSSFYQSIGNLDAASAVSQLYH
jgi:hypothetical protein